MASGTVKKVVADRGFGFITGEDGKDYFFHRDGVSESVDFDRLVGGEARDVRHRVEPARPPRCERRSRRVGSTRLRLRNGRPVREDGRPFCVSPRGSPRREG